MKNRSIKVFAENVNGHSVFLPRFICPLEPPPQFSTEGDNSTIIEKCIWYVSLIPHVEDNKAFKDLPDVWSTCQEFLDLCAGDYEEHAILLCNYLKFLDKDNDISTYIVIGDGVPEGSTVYVMRKDNVTNDIELWNASTGVGYSFK
ncbi:MAG: hypothetical protein V2I33_25950 [Kangiellaceae bacterium]|nr:hypothetical protein [Kangiellaceae bacterium]